MRHKTLLISTLFLLLLSGSVGVARGDDRPTIVDIGKIQPPGGVPLLPAGRPVTVEAITKTSERLEAAPAEDLTKWVVELERLTDQKFDSDLEQAGCRTYFVSQMSLAFDENKWNAKIADRLFQRAQAMPPSETKAWKAALESVLKREIERAYRVPLVLIPVDALHEGQKYSAERGRKYLARLKQLTAEDVSLWRDKVDEFGGSDLDAAINIILLDDYFDQEKFQRDKFRAAVAARRK